MLAAALLLAVGAAALSHPASVSQFGPSGDLPLVSLPAVECSLDYQNCTATRCCKTTGHKCYRQSKDWATCKKGKTELIPSAKSLKSCVWTGTNCMASRCCKDKSSRCYKKNATYGVCEYRRIELTNCHTATRGEACHRHALWVLRTGIRTKPEYYKGLYMDSELTDVQSFLHRHEKAKSTCPLPCTP